MAKSKYETHVAPYLDRIKLWVAKGATQKEVAEKLEISQDRLIKYKKEHLEFAESIDIPRGAIDDEVEAALYKRCKGYDYEEVTKWQTIGPGGKIIWLEKRTTKHLPPDPSSIQFWLTNRRKPEWKRMPDTVTEEAGDERGVIMMPEVRSE